MAEQRIGFIGLGAMGAGMAANVVKAGFATAGIDVRAEAVDTLKEPGGRAVRPRMPTSCSLRPRAPAAAVREAAWGPHAMLLANHGPAVAGNLLDAAVYNAEELEETAKLFPMLRGCITRGLDEDQTAALRETFPN